MDQVVCPLFVGREPERKILRRIVEGAASGAGGLVAVVGEQGIGKSRLLRQTAQDARDRRVTVLAGRGVASESTTAFRPVTEALLGHFRGRPRYEDPDLVPFEPALGRLVPPWATSSRPIELSPMVAGEALLRLLTLTADRTGCLVVLDDLHWADVDTLAVLEYLADHLPRAPVACVVALRPGERDAVDTAVQSLANRRALTRIELPRLSPTEVQLMARACLDEADPPAGADQLLLRRAGGLPFYVEELLAAVRSGLPHDDRIVPTTVEDLVGTRLAAIGPDAHALFSAAAVIGAQFDLALAAETADVPLSRALVMARAALAQQILVEEGDGLRFRHALTRDAILGRLLGPERRVLAASALVTLERHDVPRGLAAEVAMVAGEPARAARYLLDAARQAMAGGALGSARDALERALSLARSPEADDGLVVEITTQLVAVLARAGETEHCLKLGTALLASTALADQVRSDVHLELARVAVAATRWDVARHHLSRVQTATDSARAARVDALAARVAAELGQQDEAQRRARAVLDQGNRAPDAACEALHVLGQLARTTDLQEARAAFAQAEAVASHQGLTVERIVSVFELGTIDLLTLGPRERLSEALTLAEESGALAIVVAAHLQLAWWWEDRGASEEMLDAACRARRLASRLGMTAPAAMAATAEATALALRGDTEGVDAALAAAADIAGHDPDVVAAARGHARATLALAADDRNAAVAELDAAADVLRSKGRSTPMPMWGLRALIRAVDGRETARALEDADRVMVHALVAAYVDLARAVLAGRAGDAGAACAFFTRGDSRLAGLGWVQALARRHVAEAAIADGWGTPACWLEDALPAVDRPGTGRVADGVRSLLRSTGRSAPRSRRRLDLPEPLRSLGVTPREAEVLTLLASGASTREMADSLYLSPKTVERHVENLVAKTGTGNRRRLVVFAAANLVGRNGDSPDAGVSSSG